ncbi:MAG: diaminopimelate decarboxylase [Abitibacteriaceae bacterium]|nr:diaminopimelate decarboxylase [Abditibacteriaceae bacterium]
MFLLGTQRINEAGHLEIGGCDTVELAEQYGTPLYVMDEAHIRHTMRTIKKAFQDLHSASDIIYASKAFTCLAIARIVAQEGLMLDVASAGELFTALRADFPVERIVFHGNNKSREELEMAVQCGIGRVVVDNENELSLLDEVAAANGVKQAISLRLTPAVDPHTHRYIQTGRVDTKFGMNIEGGGARRGVEKALQMQHLELRGLSCHIGSQILEADFFKLGATLMCEFLAEVKRDLGFTVQDLDVGGGLGIRYLPEHQPPSMQEYAATVVGAIKEQCVRLGLAVPHLEVEPGRALVGEAGVTLYRVGGIKRIPNIRNYVAVDGGMSDNPRPALYEARYSALNASHAQETERETVTISGKHCETDTLIEDISLAPLHTGDIVAVQSTGAYNHSMSSNYNRFRRPAVVLVNEGASEIIVERETLQDLLAHDVVPERLLV